MNNFWKRKCILKFEFSKNLYAKHNKLKLSNFFNKINYNNVLLVYHNTWHLIFFPWLKFHSRINDFYYGIFFPFCQSIFEFLVMNSLQSFFLKKPNFFSPNIHKKLPQLFPISKGIKKCLLSYFWTLLNLTKRIYRQLPFEEHHKNWKKKTLHMNLSISWFHKY